MAQMLDFLRSVSVHFGTETDLKNSQISPICGEFDPLWSQTWNP